MGGLHLFSFIASGLATNGHHQKYTPQLSDAIRSHATAVQRTFSASAYGRFAMIGGASGVPRAITSGVGSILMRGILLIPGTFILRDEPVRHGRSLAFFEHRTGGATFGKTKYAIRAENLEVMLSGQVAVIWTNSCVACPLIYPCRSSKKLLYNAIVRATLVYVGASSVFDVCHR